MQSSIKDLSVEQQQRFMDMFEDRVSRALPVEPVTGSTSRFSPELTSGRVFTPAEVSGAITSAARSMSTRAASTLRNLSRFGKGVTVASIGVAVLSFLDDIPPEVSEKLNNILLALGGVEATLSAGISAAAAGASSMGVVGAAAAGLAEFAAGAAFIALSVQVIVDPAALFNPDSKGPDLDVSLTNDGYMVKQFGEWRRVNYFSDYQPAAQEAHEKERQRLEGVALRGERGADPDRMTRVYNKLTLIRKVHIQASNLENLANVLGPKYVRLIEHGTERLPPISIQRMGYGAGSIKEWVSGRQVTGNRVFPQTSFSDLITRVRAVFNEVMIAEVLREGQDHDVKSFNVSELTPYLSSDSAMCIEELVLPKGDTVHGETWTLRVLVRGDTWVISVDSDPYNLLMGASTFTVGNVDMAVQTPVFYHVGNIYVELRKLVGRSMYAAPSHLYFTGYAYGGALASALSYWWLRDPPTRYPKLPKPTVITFGSPRYGNRVMASQSTHRVLHHVVLEDTLPSSPPSYVHDGAVIRLLPPPLNYDIWHGLPGQRETGKAAPLSEYYAHVRRLTKGRNWTPGRQWDLSVPEAWSQVAPIVVAAGATHRELSDQVLAGVKAGLLPKQALANYFLGLDAYLHTTTESVNGHAYTPAQAAQHQHVLSPMESEM